MGVVDMLLPCKITKAMFRDERIVKFQVGKKRFTAVVDGADVIETEEPRTDQWTDGLLKVEIVKTEEKSALIDLPRETTTTGKRMYVPYGMLQAYA